MVEQKKLMVTTPSDLEIVMTRTFNAPRALLFEALTKPEHLVRWFGPREDSLVVMDPRDNSVLALATLAVCEVDLRVGGSARFVWRSEDGSEMGITQVYREIVTPERIEFTETFDEPYRDEMGGETLNTFALEERDGKTAFTATTLYKSLEDRDRALQTGMADGAAEVFDRLGELVETMK